jgi:hypothetical protein
MVITACEGVFLLWSFGAFLNAIAIADGESSEINRSVHRCTQIHEVRGIRLDDEDTASRTDRRNDIDIQCSFLRPVEIRRWKLRGSILTDLAETPISCRA